MFFHSIHADIKFTLEINNSINFLDLTITIKKILILLTKYKETQHKHI